MKVADFTDDQIVAAVPGEPLLTGGRGYHIAKRLVGHSGTDFCRALHRRLCKLESAGLVYRCPRYSAVNSIFWRQVVA